MSWETDYTTALPHLDADTIRKAALTTAELCPREHLADALLALGLTTPPPKPAKRDTSWRGDVLRLHNRGMQPTAIARYLGITRGAVWHHLHRAGIRAEQ